MGHRDGLSHTGPKASRSPVLHSRPALPPWPSSWHAWQPPWRSRSSQGQRGPWCRAAVTRGNQRLEVTYSQSDTCQHSQGLVLTGASRSAQVCILWASGCARLSEELVDLVKLLLALALLGLAPATLLLRLRCVVELRGCHSWLLILTILIVLIILIGLGILCRGRAPMVAAIRRLHMRTNDSPQLRASRRTIRGMANGR